MNYQEIQSKALSAFVPFYELATQIADHNVLLAQKSAEIAQQTFAGAFKVKTADDAVDLATKHYEASATLAFEATNAQLAHVFDGLRRGYETLVRTQVVPNSVLASAQVEKAIAKTQEQAQEVVESVKAAVETVAEQAAAPVKAVRKTSKKATA